MKPKNALQNFRPTSPGVPIRIMWGVPIIRKTYTCYAFPCYRASAAHLVSVVVTCVWESPPADPGFRECKCRASDPPQAPMEMEMVVAAIIAILESSYLFWLLNFSHWPLSRHCPALLFWSNVPYCANWIELRQFIHHIKLSQKGQKYKAYNFFWMISVLGVTYTVNFKVMLVTLVCKQEWLTLDTASGKPCMFFQS